MIMVSNKAAALLLLLVCACVGEVLCFTLISPNGSPCTRTRKAIMLQAVHDETNNLHSSLPALESMTSREDSLQRRSFLSLAVGTTATAALSGISVEEAIAASSPPAASIDTVLPLVKEARSQLDPIPDLIKREQWDSVRAILITPPLSDAWSKTSKLLQRYADAIGELPTGDEFAALELKEEALDHLRFLDMAVYNNVFNPIKTEGETGATKELIRSYYEDPINEYKAVIRVFDSLVDLSK